MKRFVGFILTIAMVCCNIAVYAYASGSYPEAAIDPATGKVYDFGGKTIQILDFWTGYSGRDPFPDEKKKARYDYEDWIFNTYNVNIIQKQGGDWNTCADKMMSFTDNPDGSLRIYIIEPGKVGKLISKGYAAPIYGIYTDLQSESWNSAEHDYLTIAGSLYGLCKEKSEPRQCLYFNKRVLEEAGIEWNTVYDMQKDGTWTWDAWEQMMKKIHRDTDNDGAIDIFGFTGSSDDLMLIAAFSNGGCFFDYNSKGELEPTMNSAATKAALTWAKKMKSKYFYYQPAGGNWDYYKEAFKAGNIGFYIHQCYSGFNDNAEMADMRDEWGCVAFPVPKDGDKYVTIVSDNIAMIPSCYDDDTVARLAFLYDLWTAPTPGYNDEDSWIGNKYNYTDERAVDETYAMLRDPEHCVVNHTILIGSVNDVLGIDFLWCIDGEDVDELVEYNIEKWINLCDQTNSAFRETVQKASIILLPDSLNEIDSEALYGINAKCIVVTSNCQYIAPDAFGACKNLKYIINYSNLKITAPENVKVRNMNADE